MLLRGLLLSLVGWDTCTGPTQFQSQHCGISHRLLWDGGSHKWKFLKIRKFSSSQREKITTLRCVIYVYFLFWLTCPPLITSSPSQNSSLFFRYQPITGMFFHHLSHYFKVYWPQHRLMDGQPQFRHEGGCEWEITELGHRGCVQNRTLL